MSTPTEAALTEIVQRVPERYSGADLGILKAVKGLKINNGAVGVELEFGFPLGDDKQEIEATVREALLAQPGVDTAMVFATSRIESHAVQQGLQPLAGIKNIIAVASGKGGVGKSTTAVNLALALSADGAATGVLDADIYGPSQPRMLGISARAQSADQKTITPLENHGVKAMSIGFLIDENEPMVWRGPMVTQALHQPLAATCLPGKMAQAPQPSSLPAL